MCYDLKWLCEMFNINHFVQHNVINRKVTKSDPQRKYYVTNSYRQHEHDCAHQISKCYCRTADANGLDSFRGTSRCFKLRLGKCASKSKQQKLTYSDFSSLIWAKLKKSQRDAATATLQHLSSDSVTIRGFGAWIWMICAFCFYLLFQDLKLCVCPICLTCYHSEFLLLWNQILVMKFIFVSSCLFLGHVRRVSSCLRV